MFVIKPLMSHAIFLIGWLGIYINLTLVVLILTSHLLASLIMPSCVKFFIVLIMTALLVPIIFLMMAFLGVRV